MPKERSKDYDSPKKGQGGPMSSLSSASIGKLSDIAIIKLIEGAMEEMLKFEIDNPTNKVYEFKEYFKEYLMTQYGLKNIASKQQEAVLNVRKTSYNFLEDPRVRRQG